MPAKTFYHGSPHRQNRPAFGIEGNQTPRIQPGRPFFLTDNLDYARHFARKGLVSVFDAELEVVIDLHDVTTVLELLEIYNQDPKILSSDGPWDEDVEGEIFDSAYRLLESPDVMRQLIAEGYQAAMLPEDIERGVTSFAILDPESIRFVRALDCGTPSVALADACLVHEPSTDPIF